MSSRFSAALANLDDSLQSVHHELASLGAALDLDYEALSQGLTDARYHAATLRDLVRAERPGATWTTRQALDLLIQEVEIASKNKRNQLKRTKLLDLANELEAGAITHRFESRAAALNQLRMNAVAELRCEAGHAEGVKELPGPEPVQWLRWACRLQQDQDAFLLLAREFPDVERFIGEMEESYWTPAKHTPHHSAQSFDRMHETPPADDPELRSESHQPIATSDVQPEPSLQHVTAEFDTASRSGNFQSALALCYGGSAEEHSASSEEEDPQPHFPTAASQAASNDSLIDATGPTPYTKYCDSCGGLFPDEFSMCPFDNAELVSIAETGERGSEREVPARLGSERQTIGLDRDSVSSPQDGTARPSVARAKAPAFTESQREGPISQAAGAELARLKAVLVKRNGGNPQAPESFNAIRPRSRLFVVSGIAAVVVLTVVLAAGYRLDPLSASRLRTTVVEASAKVVTAMEQEKVPDPVIQREVEQELTSLKGSAIQATVDDGVVTLIGRSPTLWDQLHAGSMAAQSNGVKAVKNLVQIEQQQSIAAKIPRGQTASMR
jgi:hypothetical protein